MSLYGQYSDKRKQKSIVLLVTLAVVALLGIIIYYSWSFLSVLNNPEQARKLIVEAGVWAPLVFILMQVAQVFIAPIPGQVVGLIGGYLFGPFWGLTYTLLGATVGFTLIFILARKLGRPFIEYFVSAKALARFDHLTKEKGVWVFFFIFLLPAFPDDIITFIAGLTTIRIRTLILISLAGRLPGYAVLSFTGNELAYKNLNMVAVTLILLVTLFAVAWWKRAWLRKFVEHDNRIQFIKESWKAAWATIVICTLGIILAAIILYRLLLFLINVY